MARFDSWQVHSRRHPGGQSEGDRHGKTATLLPPAGMARWSPALHRRPVDAVAVAVPAELPGLRRPGRPVAKPAGRVRGPPAHEGPGPPMAPAVTNPVRTKHPRSPICKPGGDLWPGLLTLAGAVTSPRSGTWEAHPEGPVHPGRTEGYGYAGRDHHDGRGIGRESRPSNGRSDPGPSPRRAPTVRAPRTPDGTAMKVAEVRNHHVWLPARAPVVAPVSTGA